MSFSDVPGAERIRAERDDVIARIAGAQTPHYPKHESFWQGLRTPVGEMGEIDKPARTIGREDSPPDVAIGWHEFITARNVEASYRVDVYHSDTDGDGWIMTIEIIAKVQGVEKLFRHVHCTGRLSQFYSTPDFIEVIV
jgi:hypothetical protein